MSGVSAIQQSQLWLNGGKQNIPSKPLTIAASQGQDFFRIGSTQRYYRLQIPNSKSQRRRFGPAGISATAVNRGACAVVRARGGGRVELRPSDRARRKRLPETLRARRL